MRILREGKIPSIPTGFKICSNCETEFEYDKNDIRIFEGFGVSNDPREGGYNYVWCPLCKVEIKVVPL